MSNALAEENLVSSSSHSDMLLSAEGELFWAPVITLRTLCPLDLTDWPSDRQTCLLRFVSGSFFTTEVLLFNSCELTFVCLLFRNISCFSDFPPQQNTSKRAT